MPLDPMPAVMPQPVLGPPPAPRAPHPERWTLPNGLRVIAAHRPGLPQLVIRLTLPAGSVADPPALPGTASLVSSLLTEGTQRLSADELNARLDMLGAAVHASVGHDFTDVEGIFLSDTLAEGIALFAEIVTRPAFPADETERVRAEALDALVARLDEPANVADDRTTLEAFGPEHPYALPSFGTPEGIAAVTREEMAAFHALHYQPRGAFVVVAGDYEPAELRASLETAFADWQGDVPLPVYPPVPPAPRAAGRTVLVPWEDAAQSEIRVAGIGLDRHSPDWIAAGVTNYILGGSTITGRLGANLREDKGWTYGARSAFSAGLAPGGWAAETAVDVEVTAGAVREILAEMRRMTEEPVPEAELRRAKDALVLSLPRAFETPGRIASRLATLEAYDLPRDYWETFPAQVEKVTADDVLRLAREHFDPARVVTVVVGAGIEG
ncbi:MAG TPA: pitrilysin family protein [Longimicrobiaceae bacterium]|jgi:zinc protease|nr:pitrilysin family protein [Longimicrobiaceae bacterium]